MSNNYLGDGIARQAYGCVVVIVAAVIAIGVCLFFLGRCTANRGVEFQSPIKVKGPSK